MTVYINDGLHYEAIIRRSSLPNLFLPTIRMATGGDFVWNAWEAMLWREWGRANRLSPFIMYIIKNILPTDLLLKEC